MISTYKISFVLIKILIVQLAFGTLLVGADTSVETQVLFRKGVDGYNNIRIPAICSTKDGTLLAFAEGREAGDRGDIDLILRPPGYRKTRSRPSTTNGTDSPFRESVGEPASFRTAEGVKRRI